MAGQGELAREVRAGLTVIEGKKSGAAEVHVLDRLSYNKPIRQHVREFAALFALIILAIAAVKIYKGSTTLTPLILVISAIVLIGIGYGTPIVLYPIWNAWMKFAHVLGAVMTTLLLSIAWSIVLIPVSLILRIIGKKVMNLSFDRAAKTYWEDREERLHDFKLLDKQF